MRVGGANSILGVRQLRTFERIRETHSAIHGSPFARLRAPTVRPSPDVRIATSALQVTLDVPSPRGSEVREAACVLARAARRAGYAPDELTALLRESLLPLLRRRHAGPASEWLWDRLVAWSWAAYAPGEAEGPAEVVAAVPAPTVADASGTVIGRVAAGPRPLVDRSDDARPSVYRLDAHDVITRVNTAWRTFASENGAPTLAKTAVGTSLWAHVGGTETRRLYAAVHATVRAAGRSVTLPYRCDAPAERRWMQLTVRPLGRGHLQVVSTLVRRAARTPVLLLDPTQPRGEWPLLVCGWCSRVRTAAQGGVGTSVSVPWVNVETLPAGLVGAAALPRLMHDVCPDCADEVRTALASA